MNIIEIDKIVKALPSEEKLLFSRIYDLHVVNGRLKIPASLVSWVEERFGSVGAVQEQIIVKITNLVTMEGSLFNALRARRPMELRDRSKLEEIVEGSGGDQFCRPLENTPEDSFGRIFGKSCVTASNIAKYDGFHGIVIFDEHNPIHLEEEDVADRIDVALEWAKKAHEVDPEFRNFFLMWNCLWRSGASIIHGHIQMTLSKGLPYAKIEALRRASRLYEITYGSNYFEDLYKIHQSMGLGFEVEGTKIIAYLTPIKEKEVMIFSRNLDRSFKKRLYEVLSCFINKMGVESFNVAIYSLPIGVNEHDEMWRGFPTIARIVDRGEIGSRICDIGAMELYASSVVSADPFQVALALRPLV
ncbi:MAG: hypothetical protein ACUVTL_05230 [Thermoproteota archaeon]